MQICTKPTGVETKALLISTQLCCCSLTQLCLNLCDPVDCSTLGFPVLHHHPEFAQTHVHRVGDAFQPSRPLSSTSPPALNLSKHQDLLNQSALHIRWPKYWSFSFQISPTNKHLGLISFRMDWLDLPAVQGTLKIFSNTTVQKYQFFSAQLSLQSNSHIHT